MITLNKSDLKMALKKRASLKEDEAHVWLASLIDHEKNIPYFRSLLSKDELERAGSFKFLKDQNYFIIGRGLLRCLLAEYLDRCPNDLEIVYGLWGKPCLSKEALLYFNLSHSGGYALYAFTRHYEVGIDLEYIDENLEIENIALNAFSSDELYCWKKLSLEDRLIGFFKLWACKEAYLKALGKGWLGKEQPIKFGSSIFCEEKQNVNYLTSTPSYPCYFECIPGYASAIFVNGPSLRLLRYTL